MYHYLHCHSSGEAQCILINLEHMEITNVQPNVNGWLNIGKTREAIVLINLNLLHILFRKTDIGQEFKGKPRGPSD